MRVLLVRVGAMGDVLHALPAMAALRRARPDWQIDWAVDERWVPLLVGADGVAPVVSQVHGVPTRAWGRSPLSAGTFGSIRALRRALRAERYDVVVDVQGTIRSAVIGRLAGAGSFVGFDDPRERAARRFYKTRLARVGTHVVEQNAALLAAATGVELRMDAGDVLPVDAAASARADSVVRGRRLCVLAPTAGWGAKQWPAERYGAFAAELGRRGFAVVVNARATGDAVALCVATSSGGAAEVVVSTLAELTALLRRAALFVGGDTGPTHLAAAVGTPLVGLYGPTSVERNGPWKGAGLVKVLRHASSATSHKRVEEIDGGLARLEVDDVLRAVDAVVGSARMEG